MSDDDLIRTDKELERLHLIEAAAQKVLAALDAMKGTTSDHYHAGLACAIADLIDGELRQALTGHTT